MRKLKCIKGDALKLNEGTSEESSQWEIMESACYLTMLLIQGNSCHPWRYSASLFHYGNASLRPHLPGFVLQMKVTQREFVTTHLLGQSKPCCKSSSTAWRAVEALTSTRLTGHHRQKDPHMTVCASSSCSWTSWQQAGSLGEWYDSCRAFSGNMLQQDTSYNVCLVWVLSWVQARHESNIQRRWSYQRNQAKCCRSQ